MQYSQHFSTKSTPQTQPIPGQNQVKNNAGGYVYQIDKWQQLRRFLILGSEGGTYYVRENKLTKENAENVIACIREDGNRALTDIVNVSIGGNAPKNDPAIFALALACAFGDQKTKSTAYLAIRHVCRTGTHLFTFCQAIQDLRGWSRGLRKGVAKYYEQPIEKLAYQLVKYRQRNGWTHRDVMRLAHPSPHTEIARQEIFKWTVGKPADLSKVPEVIDYYQHVQSPLAEPTAAVVRKLPWEALPTEWLKRKDVWEALIPGMPLNALMRNLNKLSVYAGVDSNLSENARVVADRFTKEAVVKARLHPLKILEALRTYQAGHGHKGSLRWKPAPMIIEALEAAFYHGFSAVEPTGKRFMFGLDVSGSMTCQMPGSFMSCLEAAAALLMTIVRTESWYEIIAFDTTPRTLPLHANMSLQEVMKIAYTGTFGNTDCSLPIAYAGMKRRKIDCFQILTDNETWAGRMHPSQALKEYRKDLDVQAKMVVWGMTATGFSIADPNDPGMMDVVGFDTSVPEVIRDFLT